MSDKEKYGKNYEFDRGFFTEPKKWGPMYVYQVGEVCIEKKYEIMLHQQDCHEITYIISGSGSVTINGKAYPVSEQDIIVNRKGEYHAIRSAEDSKLRFFYIGFLFDDKEPPDEMTALLSGFFRHDRNAKHIRDKYDIRGNIFKLINELHYMQDFSDRIIANYIEQVLILTYRNFHNSRRVMVAPEKSAKAVGYTTFTMIKYIEDNICEIENLYDIAVHLGYSYKYLSHLFKRKTGMTLQSYLNYKKMEKSVELLEEGQKSITEIAGILNYDTVQSFSRAFKRTFQKSPSQYKKTVSGNGS